jgi:DNA-binding PadR family transcriptional regulator
MPSALGEHLPLKRDVVLILLALKDAPRHGYGIMQDAERRTDGESLLQTGALYRRIRRLLADGFIQECSPPRGEAGIDERRRYYTLTAFGRRVLAAELERMARLVRRARTSGFGRPRTA